MTALLFVSLLLAVAVLGVAMRNEFRKLRQADPDRTDYQALFLADERKTR